jgi:hypothetical protein
MTRNLKSILGVTAGLLIVGATSATPCQGDPLFFARADVVLEGSIADQDSNQDSAPVSAFAAAGPGVGSAIARGGAPSVPAPPSPRRSTHRRRIPHSPRRASRSTT